MRIRTVGGGSRAEDPPVVFGVPYIQILEEGEESAQPYDIHALSEEQNFRAIAQARIDCMIRNGVTTVEIKSGYGLNPQTELLLLKIMRLQGSQLAQHFWEPILSQEHRIMETLCSRDY